jgi:TetR/AcrR family tetracycline transcriptional repressor
MNPDRFNKRLAHLEAMHNRHLKNIERQRSRIDERFDRARQRMMASEVSPSDEQQRIILAALNLLDEAGLNELSLRKLADKLNMKAPALYWHFKSKGVLIDYMAEAILRSEFKDISLKPDNRPWQDWLVEICKRLRSAMHSRQDGARIVAGAHVYPAVTLIKLFETCQQSLINSGVDPRKADLIVTTAIHLTFGRVIEEQSSPGYDELAGMDMEWIQRDYPRVAENIERAIEDNKKGYDEFEDSLRLFIGYPEKAK